MAASEPTRGLKIINAGLPRMATLSMAEAYRILGYKTQHSLDDAMNTPYFLIEDAAEATWPTIPGARAVPRYTRADWDHLWGRKYDAVTDLAAPFAPELIESYPEAKVVVVQRDFESWWPSFRSKVRGSVFNPLAALQLFLMWNILGFRGGHAMQKIQYGFFNARSKKEIESHARKAYDSYYSKIRSMVPPEKRLEYQMGSGWEPLCKFLGKEVPSVEFPHTNEQIAYSRNQQLLLDRMYPDAGEKSVSWLVGAAILLLAFWYGLNS
jgi:hypothetical protein